MSNLLHDNALWNKAAGVRRTLTELRAGRPVVAATAVTRDGTDYRLLLETDGDIIDGAEGGLLEQRTAARVASGSGPVLCETAPLGVLTGDDAAVYGDIEDLFMDHIAPDPDSLTLFDTLDQVLATGRGGLLVSRLDRDGTRVGRCLLLPDGRSVGKPLPEDVLAEARRLGPDLACLTAIAVGDVRYVLDPYRPQPPLYFAGAGLVSRLAAPLASLAGFRVVVMDVDAAFANRERFPTADVVLVVPDFVECFAGHGLDGDASVVIATRGHAYDSPVLAQALRTPAGYLGMMGCKTDGRARVEEMRQLGFSEEQLARVHTPIGLPLGGRTPGAIAMSIVAEVIQSQSARRRGRP